MQSPQPAHHQRIAITGMALVNALGNTVTEVWENSQAMRSGVQPVRLLQDDPPAFVNSQAFVPGSNTYCGVMGLINIDISRQDLKLPPQDFRAMSASTRLTLLMASRAIEEAGLTKAGYDPQRVGVFVSQNSGESASTLWDLNLTLRGQYIAELAASVGQWNREQQEDFYQRLTAGRVRPDESTMLCRLNCTAAGLVCQRYGFAGPSFSVGAACSSSMAALYTAYTLLQADIIDAAVVGGGEEIYGPLYFAEFSALGALARASEHITKPEDYSRPFDLHRNGFVLGEGAAMLVLEKRSLAHKRNAPVHGLLASMGNVTNNVGLVEPSAYFQAEAIRRSFAGLDYGPEMVDMVECHATATPQGDMAEAQSLIQCFSHKKQPTVLSGYKGQVGHTTGASGIMSLIHGLCAMRAGTYPGTLNCPNPDPALQLDTAQLRVLAAPEIWPRPESGIRRMQVNTFGFGGSCFVAQVEEDNDRQAGQQSSVSLHGSFQGQESIVDGTRLITLPHQGRDWRLGATTPQWMQELAGLANEPKPEELASLSRRGLWLSPPDPAPGVAIMCCGQGSVWPGMGRALYDSFPAAREAMDRVARAANWDILALMDEPSQEKIILTRWQQPYLFLLEYAQASYLQSLGLQPKVMSGHSLGELIALCLAGVYTPETAWTIMDTRATFMAQLEADATHETSMMSVHCTPEVLEATLKEWPELHVSNYNSPMQTILSGPRALLLDVRKTLRKRRVPAVMLGVSMAFHHPHMRRLREASVARLEVLDFRPPTLPMMSNITTGLYPDTPADIVQYIADLDENSVRWVECVRNMWNIYGVRDFVEVGPTDILCGLVADIEPKARCVAASRKEREVEAMRTAVARLYAMGHLSVRPGHGGQPSAPSTSIPAQAHQAPSAQAHKAHASPQAEAHIEAVMPIIAQATGYTREELQPDMDLRHDLAIRSSRFPLIMHEAEQQFHISLRFEDMLGVATIRDLADVLRRLQAQSSGAADSDAETALTNEAPTDSKNSEASSHIPPLLRYAPRRHTMPCSQSADQARLAVVPADQLLLVGSGPCALLCAEQLGQIYPQTVLHNCATVQEALALLKAQPLQPCRALVLALDDNADTQTPENTLTAQLTEKFLLIQTFCQGKGASFCLCVQQGLPSSALLEGLNGLSLAAALEYPACMFRTACVGQHAPDTWLAQCLSPATKPTASLADAPLTDIAQPDEPAPCQPVQWIFDQGQSHTLRLQPVALEPTHRPPTGLPLRHGDIIVVPGGARGISPYALSALAPMGCTLVLLGRSSHGDAEPLAKLLELGATVQHKICDVTDSAALSRSIGEIVAEFGRVDGLLYTAGITRDATMDALSAEDFNAVLAVKCQGLEHCLQATAPVGLRYAVAFSSLAAWLGNYGQSNYCAANRAMTALLHSFCHSRNIASRAVWLPPLDGHGMAAGPDMREQMRLRGMDNAWIQCEELGDLLARELFCGTEADIVWARILPAVPHVSLPAAVDHRAQVGLFERSERFPMVYPIQAAPAPEGLFTGGHHFSHYGDIWLKDAAPADSTGLAHRVPAAMLVECMIESALQNCPWLQSYAVHDLELDAALVCTGGITRESLFTSQVLPWEIKSDTLVRICNTSAQVYTLSANGRQQRQLAPLCQGRIVLTPAVLKGADSVDCTEQKSLRPLQPLGDIDIDAPTTRQTVDAFYRASGLGPYWQLLDDTHMGQHAALQASTHAWAKDLQAQLVFPAHTLEALLHTALMAHTNAGGSHEDRLKSIASLQFCAPSAFPAGRLYLTVFPAPDHSSADGCFDGQVHDEHGTVRMIVRTISFAATVASSGKTLFNQVEN